MHGDFLSEMFGLRHLARLDVWSRAKMGNLSLRRLKQLPGYIFNKRLLNSMSFGRILRSRQYARYKYP